MLLATPLVKQALNPARLTRRALIAS
uniref:Uncharacterized protein n=1 Tax=Arundo donax TaxID=35708 RepID=A0A0A9DML2_ARUDO